MTEEQVTKAIMTLLVARGWHIISFDFPQSGTGVRLAPEICATGESRGVIIPDIIASRGSVGLVFENKDRVVAAVFRKVAALRAGAYHASLAEAFGGELPKTVRYGIGLPAGRCNKLVAGLAEQVDFVMGVTPGGDLVLSHNPHRIELGHPTASLVVRGTTAPPPTD